MKVLSFLFLVGCVIKELNGQQCRTATGSRGQCVSIYGCEQLLILAQRMTPQDIDFLRRSHCGRIGGVPAVCCPELQPPRPPPTPQPPPPRPQPPPPRPQPNPPRPQPGNKQCTTPENQQGQCVNLYSCQSLVNLLEQSSSNQNIAYVQRSRCSYNGDPMSVCCPAAATVREPKPKDKCQASISAFPPEPTTGCCGVDLSFKNKIIGGNETGIDQYPWLVLIEYQKSGITKTSCGGSLISGRYVLTAAHCLVGAILRKVGTPVRVRLGEYDKDNEGPDCVESDAGGQDCTTGVVRIPIEKSIAHAEYNKGDGPNWHDIGLIRLNRLAPYTDFIRPICLPNRDLTSSFNPSDILTTAGWGRIERASSSRVKLYVELPFVSKDRCQAAYNKLKNKQSYTLHRGQMCAGGVKGKDSCQGDSGGPLMFEQNRLHQVVGVVSFGTMICGAENIPAVYTYVYEYISWIRSNMSP